MAAWIFKGTFVTPLYIYIYIHTDREREREKKEKEQQEYGEGANFAALRIADDYLASAQCVGDAR